MYLDNRTPIWQGDTAAVDSMQRGFIMLDNTTTVSSALNTEQLLTVDTPTLCKLLCCGRYTAIQIGDLAHARIVTNSRVLWSVQRIKEYVYKIAC